MSLLAAGATNLDPPLKLRTKRLQRFKSESVTKHPVVVPMFLGQPSKENDVLAARYMWLQFLSPPALQYWEVYNDTGPSGRRTCNSLACLCVLSGVAAPIGCFVCHMMGEESTNYWAWLLCVCRKGGAAPCGFIKDPNCCRFCSPAISPTGKFEATDSVGWPCCPNASCIEPYNRFLQEHTFDAGDVVQWMYHDDDLPVVEKMVGPNSDLLKAAVGAATKEAIGELLRGAIALDPFSIAKAGLMALSGAANEQERRFRPVGEVIGFGSDDECVVRFLPSEHGPGGTWRFPTVTLMLAMKGDGTVSSGAQDSEPSQAPMVQSMNRGSTAPQPVTIDKFCAECGARGPFSGTFCAECGSQLPLHLEAEGEAKC